MVVLQPGVARYERYLCALRGVEREFALVHEASAAGQVEVLTLAGAQYDVHLLAVAQQIGHVGKAREDVTLALDGAFEVPEVPTVALRPRVRSRGDVADGELRRLVRGARFEVDDAQLLDLRVHGELGNHDAVSAANDAGYERLPAIADRCEAREVRLRERDCASRVCPLPRWKKRAGVEVLRANGRLFVRRLARGQRDRLSDVRLCGCVEVVQVARCKEPIGVVAPCGREQQPADEQKDNAEHEATAGTPRSR